MSRLNGSGARALDFGDTPGTTTTAAFGGGRAGLRLALPGGLLRGPGKYKELERRRRRAQIAARRVLDLLDAGEDPRQAAK
jgi:hypothetical protein